MCKWFNVLIAPIKQPHIYTFQKNEAIEALQIICTFAHSHICTFNPPLPYDKEESSSCLQRWTRHIIHGYVSGQRKRIRSLCCLRQHGRLQRRTTQDERRECLQVGRYKVRHTRRYTRILWEEPQVYGVWQRTAQQRLPYLRIFWTYLPRYGHCSLCQRNWCWRYCPWIYWCGQWPSALRYDFLGNVSRYGNHHADTRRQPQP